MLVLFVGKRGGIRVIMLLLVIVFAVSCKTVVTMVEADRKLNAYDYEGCIAACNKILTINPKNSFAYAQRAAAKAKMGDPKAAMLDYDTAMKISPKTVYYHFNRAYAASEANLHQEAITEYTYAITHNYKDRACAFNNRGNINQDIKLYQNALSDYDSCLAIGPDQHKFVHVNKAYVYKRLKNFDLALKELETAIKIDSMAVSVITHYKNKSEANVLKTRYNLFSDKVFYKAVSKYDDAYNLKGTIYMQLGKFDAAFASYNDARKLLYTSAFAIAGKAKVAFYALLYYDSKYLYDSAIALNNECASIQLGRGVLHTRLQEYDAALTDFNAAIAIDSTWEGSYFARGRLHLQQANYNAAIADFTKSIQLDSSETAKAAYNARGYAYYKNHQYELAIADYDKSIAISKYYYQPYFQYRSEAAASLTQQQQVAIPAEIYWQSPVDDMNVLEDSSKLHYNEEKPLSINLKINTITPLNKADITLWVNGKAFPYTPKDANCAIKTLTTDSVANRFAYEYANTLRFPKGDFVVWLTYGNKASQHLRVVVDK